MPPLTKDRAGVLRCISHQRVMCSVYQKRLEVAGQECPSDLGGLLYVVGFHPIVRDAHISSPDATGCTLTE